MARWRTTAARQAGFAAGLLLIGCVAVVATGEVAVRLAAIPAGKNLEPHLYEPHQSAQAVYKMVAGFDGCAYGAGVRINDLGFRGGELMAKRSGERTRIALVGDSVAFGYGLAEGDTLSSQLERELRRRWPGSDAPEVINLGVCGYNLAQSLASLRHVSARIQPDIVVSVLMDNDADPAATPRWAPRTGLRRWSGELASRSALWSLLEYSWRHRGEPPWTNPAQWSRHHPGFEPLLRAARVHERGWHDFVSAFRDFDDAVAEVGAQWLVGYWGPPSALEESVASLAADAGVEYLPLQMAYRRDPDDPVYALPWDGHPSATATAEMAATLALSVMRLAPHTKHRGHDTTVEPLLAEQQYRWALRRDQYHRAYAAAARQLSAGLHFGPDAGGLPLGALWGVRPGGELLDRSDARLLLGGRGTTVYLHGEAAPGADLSLAIGPHWYDTPVQISNGTFSARLAVPEAERWRDFVQVAVTHHRGPVRLVSIVRQ